MFTIEEVEDKGHRTYIASGCELLNDGEYISGVSVTDLGNSKFSLETHTRNRSVYLSSYKVNDFVEEIKVIKLHNWKDFYEFNLDIEIHLSRNKNIESKIRLFVKANLENWKYPFSFADYKTSFQNFLKENNLTIIIVNLKGILGEIEFEILHFLKEKTISDEIKLIENLLENSHEKTIKRLRKKVYDVFISHASENKDDFVRPLAERLNKAGFSVWYDEFQLKIGDKLRRSIDKGLANSRFGIVVFSPEFFNKNWTQYELDALVQREMMGEKVILPLWHNVSKDEVMKFSPSLADTVALSSSIHTIDELIDRLSEILK